MARRVAVGVLKYIGWHRACYTLFLLRITLTIIDEGANSVSAGRKYRVVISWQKRVCLINNTKPTK